MLTLAHQGPCHGLPNAGSLTMPVRDGNGQQTGCEGYLPGENLSNLQQQKALRPNATLSQWLVTVSSSYRTGKLQEVRAGA